jgi:hypothetical protein
MADLGSIATQGARSAPLTGRLSAAPAVLCLLQLGTRGPLLLGAGRDDTQGQTTAPSQSHPRPGILKDVFWPVSAGMRSFSIDCKSTGGAPRLRVQAAPDLGIASEQIVTAVAGSGWQTLTFTFTALAAGVIWMWRERTDADLSHQLWWDNIIVA